MNSFFGINDPSAQPVPGSGTGNGAAGAAGSGSYGNNLDVPTGFTDPNGKTIQYGGFAQGLNQGQQDAAGQGQTAQMLQQMAQGKGPSAAGALLQQETNTAMANNNAQASSGSGQTGQAQARRNAAGNNAAALQNLGGQAAVARNQEQQGAISQLGGLQTNMRSQDIGTAQAFDQAAQGQAALNQGAAQMQQQGQEFGMNFGMGASQAAAGAAAGALMLMDGEMGGARVGRTDFVEPGGGAHQTFREEQTVDGNPFTLVVDWQTGKLRKIATLPLSPEEERQALGPHGAGPITSPTRAKSQMADGEMGRQPQAAPGPTDDQRFADMVRRAHPGLYRAATGGGVHADGEVGGNPAAEQLHDPNYNDSQLADAIGQSVYGGRDSGGNEYAVPGYTPPTVSPARYNSDEPGQQLSEQALQGQLDRLRYGAGPQSKEQAEAQAHPGQAATPEAGGGKDWGRIVGGALAGFANPKGVIGRLGSQGAAPSTAAKAAPLPMTKGAVRPEDAATPVAYPAEYAQAFPERQASDGEMGGDELGAAIGRAYDAANRRIEGARASKQADTLLAQLPAMRKEALHSIEYTPEEERPLLRRKPSSLEGSVSLSPVEPDGRVLEGLGYGSFGRVALDDADRGGKVTIGQIDERRNYNDGDLASSRRSYQRDIDKERREESETRAPVDIDAYVPSVDDPQGWEAADTEYAPEVAEDPAGVPANYRYKATPGEEQEHVRVSREIAATNPYGRGPQLAALFPKPAVQRVGPTDWMTALRRSDEPDERTELARDTRDWEAEQAANALHEAQLRQRGYDLVPGEAEAIPEMEAEKRSRLRKQVRALLTQWASEKTERGKYGDGELEGDPVKRPTRQLTGRGAARKDALQGQLRDLEGEEERRDKYEAATRTVKDGDLYDTISRGYHAATDRVNEPIRKRLPPPPPAKSMDAQKQTVAQQRLDTGNYFGGQSDSHRDKSDSSRGYREAPDGDLGRRRKKGLAGLFKKKRAA